jgi:hypothetical protein
MRKYLHLKFFSCALLVAIMAMNIVCLHEGECSVQESTIASDSTHAPKGSPVSPSGEHRDYDGCDTCINCACHAPLSSQPLRLCYNPLVSALALSDPYNSLPEVYLPKFIPPQNNA